MVSKCANPSCESDFKYFRGGRLFLVNLSTRLASEQADFRLSAERSEYFWLCAKCATTMTMTIDGNHRPMLALKDPPLLAKTAA